MIILNWSQFFFLGKQNTKFRLNVILLFCFMVHSKWRPKLEKLPVMVTKHFWRFHVYQHLFTRFISFADELRMRNDVTKYSFVYPLNWWWYRRNNFSWKWPVQHFVPKITAVVQKGINIVFVFIAIHSIMRSFDRNKYSISFSRNIYTIVPNPIWMKISNSLDDLPFFARW